MSKKRKVCWIIGGLAVALALFVLIVFLAVFNSPVARVERTVAQIANQYEFEISQPIGIHDPARTTESQTITRTSLDEAATDKIVSVFRDALPDFEYEESALGSESDLINFHSFLFGEGSDLRVRLIFASSSEPQGSFPGTSIYMSRLDNRSGWWEKVKSWFPWSSQVRAEP